MLWVGAPFPVRSTNVDVTIVAANTFTFDARQQRTATALVSDGHAVTLVGFAAPGLAAEERLEGGITLRRIAVDGTIASAFRPLPAPVRRAICRLLGIATGAASLPPDAPRGLDRLRHPFRRIAEITAHARRVGPWSDAVLAVSPNADVYHCKAFIGVPVIRRCAEKAGGRFVYDIADIHTEAARLARMPRWFRAVLRNRETGWMREASALTAVSDDVADEVVRRFVVKRPVVTLNTPLAFRPDEVMPERAGLLRALAGIPDERRIILYQGGFSVDRGIEELVAAMDEPALADVDVVAVFIGYGRLRGWLDEQAALRPSRVVVIDAIPPRELLEHTVDADVGFVGQPGRTLNQRLNLANKLFEYLQTAVPVVVAEGTAHCRLVTELEIGRCVDIDRPADVAAALAAMLWAPDAEREAMRAHCRTLGMERYTWERQQSGLVQMYRELAASKPGAAAVARPTA
jgi:glycosyltransferase involved in cell wall biosynthesis